MGERVQHKLPIEREYMHSLLEHMLNLLGGATRRKHNLNKHSGKTSGIVQPLPLVPLLCIMCVHARAK